MKFPRAAAAGALALLLGCSAAPVPAPMPAVPAAMPRSGFEDMGPATQAMQRDDSANPGMLWVEGGRQLWSRSPAASVRSCASCHGELGAMRGVATRYPAWDALLGRPVSLENRVNLCRQRHQGQPAWPAEHEDLLGLEAAVALQSRGMPIAPPADPRLAPFRARGQALFNQRIGQLDLSCAHCHDQRAGGRLAGSLIPQGHATGYPLYRLEWQALGSLARRVRGCMTGVRAQPLDAGSVELVELELHLAARAVGMPIETPAVRP